MCCNCCCCGCGCCHCRCCQNGSDSGSNNPNQNQCVNGYVVIPARVCGNGQYTATAPHSGATYSYSQEIANGGCACG